MAFCPQCKREAMFEEAAGFRRCASCGFQFETVGGPPVLRPAGREIGVLGIIVRFMLILAGVFVVIIGIIFVGCAVALRG